ncbi:MULTISPECIES: NarK family nitrate/nitrite MFS transporter [Micromonospora]|uniref:Nitrate/nitrite transporter n=1 Tax=Micromonospora solifontis TaxID=2487138 RepID=A0ABX9WCY3_9ACTN|nr:MULTISPECIES: nitrate/nitrite transporter [Micromonospora]NES12658.1 NarK/NasA family nitrate transporter [Micromonospora sp. PPF5-17B]NES38784.1 NarK/NasA family nitrate transporter [Micromonospora solifontis]NES54457.1 NarK/NasA family nitrate transporter [Micromonospora sp. PPF5-6]RNL93403.1 NarK/NasA family nitrate transporter [Micromonospora solifontis]
MTTIAETAESGEVDLGRRPGRWIAHWAPEDAAFWRAVGSRIARRNLIFSILAEHIGFSVWLLWSIVVVRLGDVGWQLTTSQKLWLTAVPSGVGALLRLPYTFAVPVFGGRNWTIVSALLLILPCTGLAWAVEHPQIGYLPLVLIAATAGFGGGNFASSMANISFFYPEREKGWALGLNAAGGNIGVAVVQFLVPQVVVLGGGLALARAGLMYIPLAVAAAVCAYLFMDNLAEAKADVGPVWSALRHRDTWLMSLLYIGTFGSFIGYSAAFPTLLTSVFGRSDIALAWAFLGAGIGSVFRPLGGRLADAVGGARVTVASFLLMAVGAYAALWSVEHRDLTVFFGAFMFLFVATGVGNGSTYRMISRIFQVKGEDLGGAPETMLAMRRQAAGALGVISSIGAFGGFLVPICYAWAKSTYGGIQPALRFYVGFFVVLLAVTWVAYVRPGSRMARAGV